VESVNLGMHKPTELRLGLQDQWDEGWKTRFAQLEGVLQEEYISYGSCINANVSGALVREMRDT
jgi:hypothetical protein